MIPAEHRALLLEGTPYERGQIQGEALRRVIHESIQRWKDNLYRIHGAAPEATIEQFLTDTDFSDSIQKWSPDLMDEVRGIGEGANVDFPTIFAYQLPDELWWYRRMETIGPRPEPEHCSAVGVSQEGVHAPIMGQNMDIPGFYDGTQTLLHIKYLDSDVEAFVFTFAGLIGLNGMNNQPLGICCNTLIQLDPCGSGLPVAFLVRKVLEQTSLEQATCLLFRVRHASGQNYLLGGRDEVADLECSANQVRRFMPSQGDGRLYHTNHPLVNDDLGIDDKILASLSPETKEMVLKNRENSPRRCDFLEEQLSDLTKPIEVGTVQSMLCSHTAPICVDKSEDSGRSFTFGSTVMVLEDTPELHISFGPPCSHEYQTFRF